MDRLDNFTDTFPNEAYIHAYPEIIDLKIDKLFIRIVLLQSWLNVQGHIFVNNVSWRNELEP